MAHPEHTAGFALLEEAINPLVLRDRRRLPPISIREEGLAREVFGDLAYRSEPLAEGLAECGISLVSEPSSGAESGSK